MAADILVTVRSQDISGHDIDLVKPHVKVKKTFF